MTNPTPDPLAVPAPRRADIQRLAAELKRGQTVALSTHINADGDGCGSEAALARLLGQMGITVQIVNPTPWPPMFDFLLGGNVTDRSAAGAAALERADRLLVLDISDVKRLGALAPAVRALKTPPLVIDHHLPGEEPPGTIHVTDVDACATGELVYDFAATLGLEITPAIATALYVAILTDTGGFRFSNTSPRCHAIAAHLLTAGVDPEEMYRRIYASVPRGRLRLLHDALESLEVDEAKGLAWVSIAAGALEKYDVNSESLDGIAEYPRSVAGVRLAVLFRDLGHGKVKISFRSVRGVDANALAKQFGGGGHARASGAMVAGTLDEVRNRVIEAARGML
ncbi:MAG TPA: bifunctional oligoribonuclease/PAP phosphatase NrnA [Gemmatimonadaceae bacterium]|nr:bifunctional oligoribonuclease/PAP phosphatase NrnA [Gemmatimonadaceae bacterium]